VERAIGSDLSVLDRRRLVGFPVIQYQRQPRAILRYGVAVSTVAAAAAISYLLRPDFYTAPLLAAA
jgi:hypothetical protein